MLRDVLKKHNIGMDPGFRLRGEEHGRIEAVTDTGFALGISGFTYVLYIPAMLIFGRKANRQRLLLLRGSAAPSVAQDALDTEE